MVIDRDPSYSIPKVIMTLLGVPTTTTTTTTTQMTKTLPALPSAILALARVSLVESFYCFIFSGWEVRWSNR